MTVTSSALHTVPTSFLGLSMNVEEMEDYTEQPDFPNYVKLITPDGDGPFVLRLGGTFVDASYWNGEISQIMPQYLAPAYDRVTLDDAWLQSLSGVVSATGSDVILNVDAADHDPQMALNLVEAAERDLPPGTLSAVAIGNEPNLYSAGYDGITKTTASWVKNFSALRYDALYSLYANLLERHLPSLRLAGPELSSPTAPWLQSLLSYDAGQVGLATEHYYAYNACAAAGSANYPELHKYFTATDISQATAGDAGGHRRRPQRRSGVPPDRARLLHMPGTAGGDGHLRDHPLGPRPALRVGGRRRRRRELPPACERAQLGDPRLRERRPQRGAAALRNRGLRQHVGPERAAQPGHRRAASNLKVWAVQSSSGYSVALINDTLQRERVRVTMPTNLPMQVKALTAPSPYAQSATFGGQTISASGTWQGTRDAQTVTPVTGSYWFTIPPDSAEIASTSSRRYTSTRSVRKLGSAAPCRRAPAADQRLQVGDHLGRDALTRQERRHPRRVAGDRLGRDPPDRVRTGTASLSPRNASRGGTAGSEASRPAVG